MVAEFPHQSQHLQGLIHQGSIYKTTSTGLRKTSEGLCHQSQNLQGSIYRALLPGQHLQDNIYSAVSTGEHVKSPVSRVCESGHFARLQGARGENREKV